MIVLKNVSKTFQTNEKTIQAVNNVSLEINTGDIFGIVGLSGAGKSTLIRCINLLETPETGQILIKGEDIIKDTPNVLREKRKKISMIFQHFNLLPSRNVFQNIAFPLKRTTLSKSEIAVKVRHLLNVVGMSDKENAYPSELSGGQKQRVAIARALANDPEILLCDEATSSLDPKTTTSILELLQTLNKQLNLTIVLITHEMEVVKEICHKVAVMDKGRIIEENDTFSIFSNPKESLTKELVGQHRDIEKVKELIEKKSDLVNISEDETIIKLIYLEDSSRKSIISHISRQFLIDANIIFGTIDIVDNRPIGELIVILKGDTNKREEACNYLTSKHVNVEVILDGSILTKNPA